MGNLNILEASGFLCQFCKVFEPQNLVTQQFGLMGYVDVQSVNGSVYHAGSKKWIH